MMSIEKRVPDVYGSHDLIDLALAPFVRESGRLVISESAESPDWGFALHRQDGRLITAKLGTVDLMESDGALISAIQGGLKAMLEV
jgi:hypothetical protein